MNRQAFHSLLLYAVVVTAAAGCSLEAGHPSVEGTVTLDGEPLESGLIRFVPVDGQSPTADATITAGRFSAKVPLGEKRVSISAPKVVGKQKMYDTPDTPTVDTVRELLPARYNAKSELLLTVKAGDQAHEFALESK